MKTLIYKIFKNKKSFKLIKIIGNMIFGICLEKKNSLFHFQEHTLFTIYLGKKYYSVGWNNKI